MLTWLMSVFPVYPSAVDFHEELSVLRGDVYAILLSRTVNKLHAGHSDERDCPPSLGWGLPPCHRGAAWPDCSGIVHCLFFPD